MLTLRQTRKMKVVDGEPVGFASLDMVKTPKAVRIIGALLMVLLVVGVAILLFVPWRQSVYGKGEIIVFSPMKRPQNIEAQIPGRLSAWHVRDGQLVKDGQLIAELKDLDARFLDPNQILTLMAQRRALVAKVDAARMRVEALGHQLTDLSSSRNAAVPSAGERVSQTKDRLFAAQQAVDAARQNVQTTDWQLDRISGLYDKGLRSKRDKELALLDSVKARTELERALAGLAVAKKDTVIAGFDKDRVNADTAATLDGVRAALAESEQTIAGTERDIYQLDVDINNLKSRADQRRVIAPCSGRVVRLLRVGTGETVDAGEVLAVIAPDTEDRAAAILIRDYDAPLVAVGREVRLTISGWPSLQFVGWPSIAVGTFAGRVAVIDAVDDGSHHYRVIVTPDFQAIKSKREDPWPSTTFLRPGAQATGWILLNDVPLWFELWRQFNGFQPTVSQSDKHTAAGGDASGKAE